MRKHAIIAFGKTGGSDKCFTVNKVWEPCAMTLFPDNDTSVKRSLKMIQEEMIPQRRGKSIVINGKRIKAYDIRTITLEQFRMLIACGNDSHIIPLYYALIGNWADG